MMRLTGKQKGGRGAGSGRRVLALILLGAAAAAALLWGARRDAREAPTASPEPDGARQASSASFSLVIYKHPECHCCAEYGEVLRRGGFRVRMVNTDKLDALKEKYGIAPAQRSCHTAVMGRYFIEGHVPVEAVKKLQAERPDIDGIGLPGMPAGSPGMSGAKQGPFRIYQQREGEISEFMVL